MDTMDKMENQCRVYLYDDRGQVTHVFSNDDSAALPYALYRDDTVFDAKRKLLMALSVLDDELAYEELYLYGTRHYDHDPAALRGLFDALLQQQKRDHPSKDADPYRLHRDLLPFAVAPEDTYVGFAAFLRLVPAEGIDVPCTFSSSSSSSSLLGPCVSPYHFGTKQEYVVLDDRAVLGDSLVLHLCLAHHVLRFFQEKEEKEEKEKSHDAMQRFFPVLFGRGIVTFADWEESPRDDWRIAKRLPLDLYGRYFGAVDTLRQIDQKKKRDVVYMTRYYTALAMHLGRFTQPHAWRHWMRYVHKRLVTSMAVPWGIYAPLVGDPVIRRYKSKQDAHPDLEPGSLAYGVVVAVGVTVVLTMRADGEVTFAVDGAKIAAPEDVLPALYSFLETVTKVLDDLDAPCRFVKQGPVVLHSRLVGVVPLMKRLERGSFRWLRPVLRLHLEDDGKGVVGAWVRGTGGEVRVAGDALRDTMTLELVDVMDAVMYMDVMVRVLQDMRSTRVSASALKRACGLTPEEESVGMAFDVVKKQRAAFVYLDDVDGQEEDYDVDLDLDEEDDDFVLVENEERQERGKQEKEVEGATDTNATATIADTNAAMMSQTMSNTMSQTMPDTNAATMSSTMSNTNAATMSSTMSKTNDVSMSQTMSDMNDVSMSQTMSDTNAATMSETMSDTNAATMSETISETNADDVSATSESDIHTSDYESMTNTDTSDYESSDQTNNTSDYDSGNDSGNEEEPDFDIDDTDDAQSQTTVSSMPSLDESSLSLTRASQPSQTSSVDPVQTTSDASSLAASQTTPATSSVDPVPTTSYPSSLAASQTTAVTSSVDPVPTTSYPSSLVASQTASVTSSVDPVQTTSVTSSVDPVQTSSDASALAASQTTSVTSSVDPVQTTSDASSLTASQTTTDASSVDPVQTTSEASALVTSPTTSTASSLDPRQVGGLRVLPSMRAYVDKMAVLWQRQREEEEEEDIALSTTKTTTTTKQSTWWSRQDEDRVAVSSGHALTLRRKSTGFPPFVAEGTYVDYPPLPGWVGRGVEKHPQGLLACMAYYFDPASPPTVASLLAQLPTLFTLDDFVAIQPLLQQEEEQEQEKEKKRNQRRRKPRWAWVPSEETTAYERFLEKAQCQDLQCWSLSAQWAWFERWTRRGLVVIRDQEIVRPRGQPYDHHGSWMVVLQTSHGRYYPLLHAKQATFAYDQLPAKLQDAIRVAAAATTSTFLAPVSIRTLLHHLDGVAEVDALVVNADGAATGVHIVDQITIPCAPAPFDQLQGTVATTLEPKQADGPGLWKPYKETVDLLTWWHRRLPALACAPHKKVVNPQGQVVAVLTQTGQRVEVVPPSNVADTDFHRMATVLQGEEEEEEEGEGKDQDKDERKEERLFAEWYRRFRVEVQSHLAQERYESHRDALLRLLRPQEGKEGKEQKEEQEKQKAIRNEVETMLRDEVHFSRSESTLVDFYEDDRGRAVFPKSLPGIDDLKEAFFQKVADELRRYPALRQQLFDPDRALLPQQPMGYNLQTDESVSKIR